MPSSPRSKRWILPAVIVVTWLFIGGPLGSFAGQLSTIQENDNAAFLPQSAESTLALNALLEFQDEETFPTTVVFERRGGLTTEDEAAIAAYAEELAGIELVPEGGVAGPIPSADGEAAQLVVQAAASDGDEVTAAVEEMRALLSDPPDGLSAYVGGQGGILGDFIVAFEAIDGLLLGVALSVVLVILLIVYRSPVLPFVVLISAVLALGVASAAIYGVAKADLLTVNGQSQGILFILAVGAATDYALLVVARFREELRDHESKYDAMRAAYRGAFEPILASGSTVILGLLCLLLSDLSSLRGLGPVGAFGIAGAMLAALTLLPAALVLLGRRAFWPFMPAFGSEHTDARSMWGALARLIGRRARLVWSVTFAGLLIAAGFFVTLNEEQVPQTDLFLSEVDSVKAQEILDAHFEADTASPAQLVVPVADLPAVIEFVSSYDGVAQAAQGQAPPVVPLPDSADPTQPKVVDGNAVVFVTLAAAADSSAAIATVKDLRT
ncbi:MMPL family transporter, partial [Nocardioides sp.]|uniref:MMPL family transporter n=1 Tax=Nocardioides sp. TaxID=35761 RepID=UPI0027367C02